ncbi:MAG: ferritin-like domain-containing protein [Acidimicrobiales bacterium]
MTTAVSDTRASELLAVPVEQRDLGWLQRSLQVAAELELFTLPPYFCGQWSANDVSSTIQRITFDEMGHLGLALNLLVAVGGTPTVATRPPVYPGPLPGGLMPGLTVPLRGLTKDYLGAFMQIEHPGASPLTPPPPEPSIATFYQAIYAAIEAVNPTISTARQLESFIGVVIVETVDDARAALDRLRDEGEGTTEVPNLGEDRLPHYYRFAEIFHGKTLVEVDGALKFAGEPVEFTALPMAPVPAGGWPNPSAEVKALLDRFDRTFSSLLNHLQRAWGHGDSDALDSAVANMRFLRGPASDLMEIPLPGGGGNYGPQFRYLGPDVVVDPFS